MKKTFRRVALCTALVCATFAAASCSDGELAEKADGSWINKSELTDEDGDPYTQISLITFHHAPDGTTDGGTFVERTYWKQDWEDENLAYSYASTTEVKGEWEIVMGDLHQTYDLSSLTVSLDHFDYKPANADVAWQMLDYTLENLGQDLIDKEEFGEEMRKADYKDMRAHYASHNKEAAEGACFTELKITGETLSFVTDDMGRMTYHSISDTDVENESWKN